MNESSILIKGARLYGAGDPVDVLVTDGQIAEIGSKLVADLGMGQRPAIRTDGLDISRYDRKSAAGRPLVLDSKGA